ncbi:hypothetical protein GCM10009076_15440 [Erythrobacter ramosus]
MSVIFVEHSESSGDQQFIIRSLDIGMTASRPCNPANDKPGINLRQTVIIKPQSLGLGRAELMQKHICVCKLLANELVTLRGGVVAFTASLAPVPIGKGRPTPGWISSRSFELENISREFR